MSLTAMPDTFIPLVAPNAKTSEALFTSLHLKPAPGSAAKSSAESQPDVAAPEVCAKKPVVTLQRSGDIVSGIRIQCGCGQVIELNCVY